MHLHTSETSSMWTSFQWINIASNVNLYPCERARQNHLDSYAVLDSRCKHSQCLRNISIFALSVIKEIVEIKFNKPSGEAFVSMWLQTGA